MTGNERTGVAGHAGHEEVTADLTPSPGSPGGDEADPAVLHVLTVIAGAAVGAEYIIDRPTVVVGRSVAADFTIPDDRASRFHLQISRLQRAGDLDSSFELLDLGSKNGTSLNGTPIERADLREGDKIRLGDTVLSFQSRDVEYQQFFDHILFRAFYDDLTELLNRRAIDEEVRREFSRALRFGRALSIVFFDVDHFKAINDRYGHATGDEVLRHVANVLRESIREQDELGRYGGEEFLALLVETAPDQAVDVAERTRLLVERTPFEAADGTLNITVSAGVAGLPPGLTGPADAGADRLRDLLRAADMALYDAKASGRNRVCRRPGPFA